MYVYMYCIYVCMYICRYVLGHEAMQKMSKSNILISGMKGLGVEIGMSLVTMATLGTSMVSLLLR